MNGARLRTLRARIAHCSGSNWLARRRLDGRSAAVLNYHRVLDFETAQREAVEEGMYVTPQTFERQLDWLLEHFRVLPLGEIVSALRAGRPLPERACAITFDDGWRDNLTNAYPALEARRLPSTVFVVTGRIGSSGAFWPDEICQTMRGWPRARQIEVVRRLGATPGEDPTYSLLEHLKDAARDARDEAIATLRAEAGPSARPVERVLLDWDELARMTQEGVAVEAHGVSHDMLTGLDDETARQELVGSRRALLERGHGLGGFFAYPAGRHDARVCRLTEACGFSAAFTIERRVLDASADRFAMPRLMLHEGMSSTKEEFLMRVPGWA